MKMIDSNLRKVNNAIKVIEHYNLKSKSRKRDFVYKRAYMMAKLKQLGCTFKYVGDLFEKDHATVLHHVRNHNYFISKGDLEYRLAIQDVRESYKILNDQIQSNIFADVLEAKDFEDLLMIKEKIHKGFYSV